MKLSRIRTNAAYIAVLSLVVVGTGTAADAADEPYRSIAGGEAVDAFIEQHGQAFFDNQRELEVATDSRAQAPQA